MVQVRRQPKAAAPRHREKAVGRRATDSRVIQSASRFPNWMRSAVVECAPMARSPTLLLGDAGEDDLGGGALPLRPEGRLVVGLEREGAARIDGEGVEDPLVLLARDLAGLAAFAFDEADGRSPGRPSRPGRSGRTRCAGRAVVSSVSLLALDGTEDVGTAGKRERCNQSGGDRPRTHANALPSVARD